MSCKDENLPLPAVVDPILPGVAKVAPPRKEALRLATVVVEATTKGAVPEERVEVNCPLILIVVIPDKAPELIIKELMVFVVIAAVIAPAVVTVKLVKLIKLVPAVVPERIVSQPVPMLRALSVPFEVEILPILTPLVVPPELVVAGGVMRTPFWVPAVVFVPKVIDAPLAVIGSLCDWVMLGLMILIPEAVVATEPPRALF